MIDGSTLQSSSTRRPSFFASFSRRAFFSSSESPTAEMTSAVTSPERILQIFANSERTVSSSFASSWSQRSFRSDAKFSYIPALSLFFPTRSTSSTAFRLSSMRMQGEASMSIHSGKSRTIPRISSLLERYSSTFSGFPAASASSIARAYIAAAYSLAVSLAPIICRHPCQGRR